MAEWQAHGAGGGTTRTRRTRVPAPLLAFLAVLLAPLLALLLALLPTSVPAFAATSTPARAPSLEARLITALDGVAPDAVALSAALHVDLDPGWKTYWRSPGAVGLPPTLDWSGSRNVAEARIAYPAPTRFRAFDIENYGYGGEVAYPIEIRLERPGEAAALRLTADLLACAEVCVPERVALTLDLPAALDGAQGTEAGLLDPDGAATIARWAEAVPVGERFGDAPDAARSAGVADADAHADADALTVRLHLDPPLDPAGPIALFPTMGRAAFGAPEFRVAGDGALLWARLPVVSPPEADEPLAVTLVAGGRAATLPVALGDAAIEAPAGAAAVADPLADPAGPARSLPAILLLALLGGLVLNAMPCVLPVLSIKLAGAIGARERALREVRAGFLATAAGILAFALALAGALLAVRAAGGTVGWGVQFQSPAFLAAVAGIVALFGANMLGAFAVALPSGLGTRLARASAGRGLLPDFLTGAFAALLATPCSAPFLGTAVAFALAGSALDAWAVFAALGLGLAAPYLAVAARPSLVRLLPRPGPWMERLRVVLGGALLLTALWLVSVLASAAGVAVALIVTVVIAGTVLALWVLRGEGRLAVAATGLLAALAVPLIAPPPAPVVAEADPLWQPFDRAAIAPAIARGEVVFVDVTADWCLTCKANKAATLDREPVASLLAAEGTVAMRADWTRPDESIAAFLRDNGRYGIPFNAVYGPAAPEGIVLPELLSPAVVTDAMERARSS